MEHIGAVSMGGEEINIALDAFHFPLFSFVGNDLCIWLAPLQQGSFPREEFVMRGGFLMSERQLLSRIRCLQASGDGSWMSKEALRLLRQAKESLKKVM